MMFATLRHRLQVHAVSPWNIMIPEKFFTQSLFICNIFYLGTSTSCKIKDKKVNVKVKVRVKVKLSLCFNWAPSHEGVLGEWRYSSTHSLTSTLDGGEWSYSRPGHFTPRERASGTHWIGRWVGPRAVLDAVVKRKSPSPSRESNTRTPIVQPEAQRYTDWAIKALNKDKQT
jgi:hypothetical protein